MLILGIGNSLLSDEGIGCHAIRYLQRSPLPPWLRCIDGGTISFPLAAEIASAAGVVVIDAARIGSPPGSHRLLQGEAMDHFLEHQHRPTVHEVGLRDLIYMGKLSGDLPTRRALLAVEPESIGWGEALTPAVQTALPTICQQAQQLTQVWYDELA
ncbi:hydrogenase maturation protease [Ectothiorhodospiraceae bacterium BW-2]|nr:hydrogenase maturation protease [Ectothiorhodospiraceae bacterium BW-2]